MGNISSFIYFKHWQMTNCNALVVRHGLRPTITEVVVCIGEEVKTSLSRGIVTKKPVMVLSKCW
jgi:hypothetical protein